MLILFYKLTPFDTKTKASNHLFIIKKDPVHHALDAFGMSSDTIEKGTTKMPFLLKIAIAHIFNIRDSDKLLYLHPSLAYHRADLAVWGVDKEKVECSWLLSAVYGLHY